MINCDCLPLRAKPAASIHTKNINWIKMDRAQYQKNRREYLKSIGICIRCGKEKAISNMVLCSNCREKNNSSRRGVNHKQLSKEKRKEQYKIYKEKYYPKYKERYYTRKNQGLCVVCGKPALKGLVMCYDCRLYQNQYKSGYYEHTDTYIKKEIKAGRLKA